MAREITLEERVAALERDVRDHSKTLTFIVEKLQILEAANHSRALLDARAEERAIARGEKLEEIQREVAAIKGVGTKLLWIVISAVCAAFVAFILRGGLVL